MSCENCNCEMCTSKKYLKEVVNYAEIRKNGIGYRFVWGEKPIPIIVPSEIIRESDDIEFWRRLSLSRL